MTPLRDTAVLKLLVAFPRLDPVKQIAIARKYHCDELVKEPFETLVARKEVLSEMEIAQLPLGDLREIIVSREEALQRGIVKATVGHCSECTNTLWLAYGYCSKCRCIRATKAPMQG